MAVDFVVKTQKEVAEFFGVSLTVIRGNWSAAGCPLKKGSYSLKDIYDWREDRRKRSENVAPTAVEVTDSGSASEAFSARHPGRTLEYERARWQKLKSAKLSGELVPRQDIIAEITEFAQIVGEMFDRAAERVAVEFDADQREVIRASLTNIFNQERRRVADWTSRTTEFKTDDSGDEPEETGAPISRHP